jgi:hypothetical protein
VYTHLDLGDLRQKLEVKLQATMQHRDSKAFKFANQPQPCAKDYESGKWLHCQPCIDAYCASFVNDSEELEPPVGCPLKQAEKLQIHLKKISREALPFWPWLFTIRRWQT